MNETVKKNALKFGIILGVISILSTVLIYIIDPTNFVNIWVGISMFVLNLIVGIIAVIRTKKELNGFISFKNAFTSYFLAMALGSLIGIVFMYLLFNFIDPSVKDIILDGSIKMTVDMMSNMGVKTEDIKKTVEAMKEADNFGLVGQIKSFFGGLVVHAIIGLIVAAVSKKESPFTYAEETNKEGAE